MISHEDTDFIEKTVLCKVINNLDLLPEFWLEPEYFKDKRHKNIAEFITTEINIDPDVIKTEAIVDNDKYGGYEFVDDIINNHFATAHGFNRHQEEIFDFYKHRETERLITEYKDKPTNSGLDEIRNRIDALNNTQSGNTDSKKDTLLTVFKQLHGEEIQQIVPTRFDELDRIIDGFGENQLNLIAARPSAGKTAFALNLAMNMQSDDVEVLVCSLETNELNLTNRILSSLSGVHLKKFKNPVERMSDEEMKKANDKITTYQDMNIRIHEPNGGFTPNTLRKLIMGMSDDKHKVIFIDYLTLMKSDRRTNSKYEEVSDISRELKIIANAYPKITVVALAQLNRAVEQRQDKTPNMSDLRDSGQIEQDGDLIMMLSNIESDDENFMTVGASPVNLAVVKNKDGPLGEVKIDFYKQNQRMF